MNLVEIRLYGHLRKRFARSYRLAVQSPAEAVRALCAIIPGFQKHVIEHSEPGYRIVVAKAPIGEDELHNPTSARDRISIVPVVAGSAGTGKILAGVALIAVSFIPGLNVAVWSGYIATTWSAIAFNVGVSLVLGGVSQMLAGSPKGITPSERPNNQPSFSFNGVVNTTAQGNPVQICYGRLRIGSQVISTGLSTAQLA